MAKKLLSAYEIKIRMATAWPLYCELFMRRDGFTILALDYATSLNKFVSRSVLQHF